jgi:CDP-diacylglycerol--glycerol-3-phosphate 3-phosphatidyltransferase
MVKLWEAIKRGYLRVIAPVADWMVARRISPNAITTVGTLCAMAAGVIYATGHIHIAGWVLGLTALFDVLDGTVARRTGRSTVFGAFYDSTLDRVAAMRCTRACRAGWQRRWSRCSSWASSARS